MPGFNITSTRIRDSAPAPEGTPGNKVETIRKHRYKIIITGSGLKSDVSNLICFFAKSCTVPSVTFDEIVVHHGQDKIFMPGKWNYNPVDITFYEITNGKNSVLSSIYYLLPNEGLYSQLYEHPGSDPLNIKIQTLLGNGDVANCYKLYECYIEKYEPSGLDYTDSAISEVSISVKYNRFEFFEGDK